MSEPTEDAGGEGRPWNVNMPHDGAEFDPWKEVGSEIGRWKAWARGRADTYGVLLGGALEAVLDGSDDLTLTALWLLCCDSADIRVEGVSP